MHAAVVHIMRDGRVPMARTHTKMKRTKFYDVCRACLDVCRACLDAGSGRRWYRAPELLLSCDHYTASIDVWSGPAAYTQPLCTPGLQFDAWLA